MEQMFLITLDYISLKGNKLAYVVINEASFGTKYSRMN